MNLFKKVAVVSILGILSGLSACGGNASVQESEVVSLVLPAETYEVFETPYFYMQYPRDWEVKDNAQIEDRFKETVQAVISSNFKDPFFTPVITIEALPNTDQLANPEFAEAFIKKNETSLINYEEIERTPIVLNVGVSGINTYLVRFKGKGKLQDDILEFLQVYVTGAEYGYIVTGAFDPNGENLEIDKMVQSLQTVRVKD